MRIKYFKPSCIYDLYKVIRTVYSFDSVVYQSTQAHSNTMLTCICTKYSYITLTIWCLYGKGWINMIYRRPGFVSMSCTHSAVQCKCITDLLVTSIHVYFSSIQRCSMQFPSTKGRFFPHFLYKPYTTNFSPIHLLASFNQQLM